MSPATCLDCETPAVAPTNFCQTHLDEIDALFAEAEAHPVCECELDWNCGMHKGSYTALEVQNDEWANREEAPAWAR